MMTEDQLEQLAIQWFQNTGWNYVHGAVIAPEGVAAEREDRGNIDPSPPVGYAGTRHRTPNIEHRSEEKRSLEEAVRISGSRQISRQSVARDVVDYRDMNRDIMSRFGSDSGRKLGIATEIPTKCRDFALLARGEAESRQLSRPSGRSGLKKEEENHD